MFIPATDRDILARHACVPRLGGGAGLPFD